MGFCKRRVGKPGEGGGAASQQKGGACSGRWGVPFRAVVSPAGFTAHPSVSFLAAAVLATVGSGGSGSSNSSSIYSHQVSAAAAAAAGS